MSISYEEYRRLVARTDLNADCPVRRLLSLFAGKWHTRVIFELTKVDSIRFGELKKQISPITNTMLSGTLRELEAHGIIVRRQFNEIPPHVEYALSESGKALYPVFYEMALWGSQYLADRPQDAALSSSNSGTVESSPENGLSKPR